MTTSRIAQCHCGLIQLRCDGEPAKVSLCHCRACQRRTGSAFGVAVFYERDKVHVEGGVAQSYERASDSGFPVRFHFCPNCGSTVYWEPSRLPHRIAVAIGAFADPDFPPPVQSVWTRDKHGWLTLPDEMSIFD